MPHADPEARRLYQWFRSKTSEKKAARKKSYGSKPHKKRSIEAVRRYNIRQKFGISVEERHALWVGQDCKCAGCRAPIDEFGRRVHIDHCHKTNRIRGLLCRACNLAIPNVMTPETLRRLADYLERHND